MENLSGTPSVSTTVSSMPSSPASPVMAQGGGVADVATPKMVEGGDITSVENSWGTAIAIGLVSLTLVSLILQISVHRKNLKKVDADDESLQKDVRELKLNVKKQMGEKYETLA